jgi:hypothetical protein
VQLDSGEIIDTVAWVTERPGAWWLERRLATHLGDRALRCAGFLGRPIRLVARPAEWLAAPRGAVCVLDWTTDLRALFRDVGGIHCSTLALARFLSDCLDKQVRHTFRIKVAS